jgi:cobalt/nickel transport system ATP-binding protein
MIALENVGMEVDGRVVLEGLSFSIQQGERVVLLGVNGCGKTTLLKLLDGLVFPTRGTIRYAGQPLDARALDGAAFRRRFRSEVALLFQNVDAMLFNPSVADEIAFGPRQLGLAHVDACVARWAEAFGVADFVERAPFELSGGEKKRVALASIFAVGPKLLLLDEVTANLDPASAARLVDFLAALTDVTVVASTHDLTVAEELGSRAILLAPGRSGILFDGPTAELVRDERLLVASGLAHRHGHRHGASHHAHFHVHAAG